MSELKALFRGCGKSLPDGEHMVVMPHGGIVAAIKEKGVWYTYDRRAALTCQPVMAIAVEGTFNPVQDVNQPRECKPMQPKERKTRRGKEK